MRQVELLELLFSDAVVAILSLTLKWHMTWQLKEPLLELTHWWQIGFDRQNVLNTGQLQLLSQSSETGIYIC